MISLWIFLRILLRINCSILAASFLGFAVSLNDTSINLRSYVLC